MTIETSFARPSPIPLPAARAYTGAGSSTLRAAVEVAAARTRAVTDHGEAPCAIGCDGRRHLDEVERALLGAEPPDERDHGHVATRRSRLDVRGDAVVNHRDAVGALLGARDQRLCRGVAHHDPMVEMETVTLAQRDGTALVTVYRVHDPRPR